MQLGNVAIVRSCVHRDVFEQVGGYRLALRQRAVGGEHAVVLLARQRRERGSHLPQRKRVCREEKIKQPLREPFCRVAVRGFHEVDLEVGMGLRHLPDRFHHEGVDLPPDSDRHALARLLLRDGSPFFFRLVQDVESLFRSPIENKPGIGGAHAARASLKDAVAELSFERVDPLGERGHGKELAFRRFVEAPQLHCGCE